MQTNKPGKSCITILLIVLSVPIAALFGGLLDLLGMMAVITTSQSTWVQNSRLEFLFAAATVHMMTLLLAMIISFCASLVVNGLINNAIGENAYALEYKAVMGFINVFLTIIATTSAQPLILDYWMQLQELGRFSLTDMGPLFLNNIIVTLGTGAVLAVLLRQVLHIKED